MQLTAMLRLFFLLSCIKVSPMLLLNFLQSSHLGALEKKLNSVSETRLKFWISRSSLLSAAPAASSDVLATVVSEPQNPAVSSEPTEV